MAEKRRILILEDEPIIGLDLEMMLRQGGCEPIGPISNLNQTLSIVQRDRIDAAVLDINLDVEMVFEVADALAMRQLFFVFLAVDRRQVLPERFRQRPIFYKPYATALLIKTLGCKASIPSAAAA